VRSAMTLVVVWLLKVPGLMLVGGALLVWIAYRLLAPQEGAEEHNGRSATTFWGAMRTIVIADAVMGLDNVLAVAGAAQGSYSLVVLGLLISIPIVIWGSTLILKWVERFPVIVYVGAGVLAWTAVKMMVSEPLVKDAFTSNGAILPLAYLAIIGGVLWTGFVKNHRQLDSRITSRLAAMRRINPAQDVQPDSNEGDIAMQRILVPVDGSKNAEFAVRHVVAEFLVDSGKEVHLLNVQPPLSQHIAQFVSRRNRDDWHRDEAEKALAPARRLLEQHGVPHTAGYKLGNRAQTIVDEARRLRCHHIVMSTARKNSLTRMLQDSTTNKVLEQTSVPVELIAGDAVSGLERWGVPAGLDGGEPREQPPRTLHHRHVDHPAVDGERGAAGGLSPGVLLDHAPGIGRLLRRGRIFPVHDRHLVGMDAARAHEAELARAPHHAAEGLPVAERRDAGDEAERHHAARARGEDHLLLGHEQRLLGRLHAGLQREILAADVHRHQARARLRDRGHLEVGRGGLDHGDQPGVPGAQPALRFKPGDGVVNPLHVVGALRLGDSDAVDVRADRGIEILQRDLERAVDAHHHVRPTAPHARRGRDHQLARRVLLRGGHAVLQVELYAVGPPRVGLGDVLLDVHRHVHQRAPDREIRLHRRRCLFLSGS
jgi:YjbE family integral membrane protein